MYSPPRTFDSDYLPPKGSEYSIICGCRISGRYGIVVSRNITPGYPASYHSGVAVSHFLCPLKIWLSPLALPSIVLPKACISSLSTHFGVFISLYAGTKATPFFA
jgi:hypothetical protein